MTYSGPIYSKVFVSEYAHYKLSVKNSSVVYKGWGKKQSISAGLSTIM